MMKKAKKIRHTVPLKPHVPEGICGTFYPFWQLKKAYYIGFELFIIINDTISNIQSWAD